jgi:UDP-N-acetylglucosamine 2-epimerase (non-hydrolysing)
MSTNVAKTSRPDWLGLLKYLSPTTKPRRKILTLFGTRPEVIKLAPVIQQLEAHGDTLQTINVASSQHTHLLHPFVRLFDVRVDHDLQAMQAGQTPSELCARVLSSLDPILAEEKPDLILIQGDTTTALAGALAGFHRGIAIGHVEAGLRSGNVLSPYPEEMNRRLITRLATYHFAATHLNRDLLLAEGVDQRSIFVTGNPVVDSLQAFLRSANLSPALEKLLHETEGLRRIVLTTHRRESFGEMMTENLRVLRRFVARRDDVALIFPVHPNPSVVETASRILSQHPRIHLIAPLDYADFIKLLSHAWLIVSDSGGVQEEAPTLGKPLLILRENTERPEALSSGVARLVGGNAERLATLLDEAAAQESWAERVTTVENPFGRGQSGKCIAELVVELVRQTASADSPVAK